VNSLPSYELELRAADERKRIHDSVSYLKSQIEKTLSFENVIRENVSLVTGVVGLAAISMGYMFTGIFTRR